MEYYFGEHLRWNLGWETPNQGGAFIATLLPWLWAWIAWTSGRFSRARSAGTRSGWAALIAVGALVETAGIYSLARTYSRGALVGLVIGAGVWALFAWRGARRATKFSAGEAPGEVRGPWRSALLTWELRGAVIAACLALSGFHERVAPGHIAEDRSSLNRVVLWRGGAELVAASPLRGWGWGQSGASFMHWTQPLDRNEGYLSMVNSYLTVAVEAGLPLFTAILAVLLLPLARLWERGGSGLAEASSSRPRGEAWRLGLAAAWGTWLGCMVFSNLWIIRLLWIAPIVAFVGLLLFGPHANRSWARATLRASGTSAMLGLALWLAGAFLAARQPLQLRRDADGGVSLRARPSVVGAEAHGPRTELIAVLPDKEVLGESYGQELRRWLVADGNVGELRVPGRADLVPSGLTAIVAFGANCAEPGLQQSQVPVWLLHPTVSPPADSPRWARGGRVSVPGIDISGQSAPWWTWAAESQPAVPVLLNHGLASDLRPQWPALALEAPWRS